MRCPTCNKPVEELRNDCPWCGIPLCAVPLELPEDGTVFVPTPGQEPSKPKREPSKWYQAPDLEESLPTIYEDCKTVGDVARATAAATGKAAWASFLCVVGLVLLVMILGSVAAGNLVNVAVVVGIVLVVVVVAKLNKVIRLLEKK
jgi:hypothetical protein